MILLYFCIELGWLSTIGYFRLVTKKPPVWRILSAVHNRDNQGPGKFSTFKIASDSNCLNQGHIYSWWLILILIWCLWNPHSNFVSKKILTKYINLLKFIHKKYYSHDILWIGNNHFRSRISPQKNMKYLYFTHTYSLIEIHTKSNIIALKINFQILTINV